MAPAPRTTPAPGWTPAPRPRTRTASSAPDRPPRRPRPDRAHRAVGPPAGPITARLSTGGEPVILAAVMWAERHQRVPLVADLVAAAVAAACISGGGPRAGHRSPPTAARALSIHPIPISVGRSPGGPRRRRQDCPSRSPDHVPTQGWLDHGRPSGPGPGPVTGPVPRGPIPRGPAVAGRIVPRRRAARVIAANDMVRLGPLRRALRTRPPTWSRALGALTDGDRFGERWIDRPVPAAAARPRRTTGARGGRDA